MKGVNWGIVSIILNIFPCALIVAGFIARVPAVFVPILVIIGLGAMLINFFMIFIIINGDLKGKPLAHVSLGLLPAPFIVFAAAYYFFNYLNSVR